MKYLKLILAIMLLLCLFNMPYGFYTLLRFVAATAFVIMAYSYYNKNQKELAIGCGAIAILFQPFIKIVLGRQIWNIVDIVIAIGLILLVTIEHQKKNQQ